MACLMFQVANLPQALVAAPDAAVATDFSTAFEMLFGLGLPDPAGASYIQFERNETRPSEEDAMLANLSYGRTFGGRQWDLGAKGNAWLLPGAKDKSGTVIFGGHEKFQVAKVAKRGGLMRALIGAPKAPEGGGVAGTWSEVDVKAEVERVVRGLDKLAAAGRAFDPDQWEYDTGAATQAGALVVLASQLHRAGHQQDGNRLAGKVLGLVPDPVAVIDSVVDTIANRQYDALVETFFEKRDWKAYHEGLEALSEKFPRGWKARLGVAILLPEVEKQARGLIARPEDWPEVNFKPEAVALLDQLLKQEETIVVDPRECWLLPSGEVEADRRELLATYGSYTGDAETQEWLKELCAMGMDGFIALANVAADETMIPTRMQSDPYGDSSFYGMDYMGSGESLEDQAKREYESLKRPCSRGEIARSILIATLPEGLDDFGSKAPPELREVAHRWWLEHRDDSPSELARHLMELGGEEQRHLAVKVLIKSGDDGDAKLVENFLLGADSLVENTAVVKAYLKARRGKASAFFKVYSEGLRDEIGVEPNRVPWQIQQAGGTDAVLRQLSVLVNDMRPAQLVAEIKAGTIKLEAGLPMLRVAVEGEQGKHLPELISLARAQAEVAGRLAILEALVEWMGEDYEDDADLLPPTIEQSKEHWEFFLSDTQKHAGVRQLEGTPSAAAYAAWAMELIYFPQHQDTVNDLYSVMPSDQVWEFITKRAAEVLELGAEAAFPDPERVSDSRRQQIRAEIAKLGAAEILAYREECSLEEKLAWSEVIAGFGEEMPQGIEALSKMVARVIWSNPDRYDEAFRKKLEELLVLKPVNQAMIEAVMDLMLQNAETCHGALLMFQRFAGRGQMLKAQVWDSDVSDGWKESVMGRTTAPLVDGSAKKMAGMQAWGEETVFATRYEPAKADQKTTVKDVAGALTSTLDGAGRVTAAFFCETAENYKKQAAESAEAR